MTQYWALWFSNAYVCEIECQQGHRGAIDVVAERLSVLQKSMGKLPLSCVLCKHFATEFVVSIPCKTLSPFIQFWSTCEKGGLYYIKRRKLLWANMLIGYLWFPSHQPTVYKSDLQRRDCENAHLETSLPKTNQYLQPSFVLPMTYVLPHSSLANHTLFFKSANVKASVLALNFYDLAKFFTKVG